MEAIFGHAMATGKFALGSGEALGQNQVDSVAAKVEGPAFTYISEERAQTDVGEGSKATEIPSIAVGRKRKRGNFSEDEMLMLTNMSDCWGEGEDATLRSKPSPWLLVQRRQDNGQGHPSPHTTSDEDP